MHHFIRLFFSAIFLVLLNIGVASAQVEVVTNGSFETGLSGWTAAPSSGNGISTNCSFNASLASGTETLTGTSSLPPSDGSQLAMGAIQNFGSGAGSANSSCVLYQDVAIPAGATTATLALRWGEIRVGGVSMSQAALLARLYSSTATVPFYLTSGTGNITFYQPAFNDTSLVSATSGSFNVSSLAGTTARLALFIAQTPGADTGRATVAGFDQVSLLVTVPPSISQAFGAANIFLNSSTSLTYTITNPAAAGLPASNVNFTNTFPAGLVVATPNGLTGSCGGGSITATSGSNSVSLTGAALASGESCTFSVNVTGTSIGTINNSVTVSSSIGTSSPTNASLQVNSNPNYAITAVASPVAGGSVTCTPNPVPHGTTSTCVATANTGYTFSAFGGDCSGSTCSLSNVTSAKSVTANFTQNTNAVTATASPTAGGTASCTPNSAAHDTSSTCTANPSAGYTFSAWTGDCAGQGATCTLNNITSAKSSTASFTVASVTQPNIPTLTSGVTADMIVSGCTSISGTPVFVTVPQNAVPNKTFPYGMLDFSLAGCSGTAQVTIVYSQPLPNNATFHKEIGGNYSTYLAQISGNTVTFTLSDNDPAADSNSTLGLIDDPSGVGVPAATASPAAIPTLSEWGMILLGTLMALFGFVQMRRRQGFPS